MTREAQVCYEIRLRTVLGPALRDCLAPCGRWTAVHRHTITRFSLSEERELEDVYKALLAHDLEVVSVRRAAGPQHCCKNSAGRP